MLPININFAGRDMKKGKIHSYTVFPEQKKIEVNLALYENETDTRHFTLKKYSIRMLEEVNEKNIYQEINLILGE